MQPRRPQRQWNTLGEEAEESAPLLQWQNIGGDHTDEDETAVRGNAQPDNNLHTLWNNEGYQVKRILKATTGYVNLNGIGEAAR